MAVFDLVTCASKEIRAQSDAIDQKYFFVDTADEITIHGWNDFNRYAFTASMLGDTLYGFFTVLPVTSECAALFERNAIQEEDLSLDFVLPHESLRYAQYAYVPAIAIRELNDYTSHQCLASLMVGITDLFLNGYDPNRLKKIYVNPTTYHGNRFVRRLGFKPLHGYKKNLTASDTYAVDFTPEIAEEYRRINAHYARFVNDNPWSKEKVGLIHQAAKFD